jgi:hypothetical protein
VRIVGYRYGVDSIPSPGDGQPQTRFHPPRIKLVVMAAGSLLLASVGYLMSLSRITWLSVVGLVLAVLFAAMALVVLARALRPGPTVVLTRDGIVDRTTLAPTGLVRWDEINVVRKREIGRGRSSERVLDVVLADRDAFFDRPRSLPRRIVDRYRKAMKHPDVSIPASMVSTPIQDVIDELHRWRPDLQVLELPPQFSKMQLIKRGPIKEHPKPPRW